MKILVDISTLSGWPHQSASSVVLDGIRYQVRGTAGSAGDAELKIGIVEENDATDGTMSIIFSSLTILYTEKYDSGWVNLEPVGLDLRLVSAAHTYGNAPVSGNETILQNDTNRTDAERNTNVNPGVGDLIAFFNEGTNGGTYDYDVLVKWHSA
jgi:hypothetical protein